MEILDKSFNYNLDQEEIDHIWQEIHQDHERHLETFGVKLPQKSTAMAMWLVFLKKYEGMLVHKDTIANFTSTVLPGLGRDQQVRHLARHGWNVLNKGDRLPRQKGKVPSGFHILLDTENPKSNFLHKALKRAGRLSALNFEQLKVVYDNRCATCGSQEARPHILEPKLVTELHQGHMNPFQALTLDNSIPQCQLCNQVYQDRFIFNQKGRVVAVANAEPVLRSPDSVKRLILEMLLEEYDPMKID